MVGTAAATPEPEARGSVIARVVAAAGRRTRSTTSSPPSAPACATTWMPGSVRPGPLVATGAGPGLMVAGPAPVGEPDVVSEVLGALEDPVGGLAAEGPGVGVRPSAQTAPTQKTAARTRPRTRCTTTERGTQLTPRTRRLCPFCRTLHHYSTPRRLAIREIMPHSRIANHRNAFHEVLHVPKCPVEIRRYSSGGPHGVHFPSPSAGRRPCPRLGRGGGPARRRRRRSRPDHRHRLRRPGRRRHPD